jgi:hypothetical protein
MRILKGVFALMAVTAVIVFAGQYLVHGAAGGPNPWAVNSSAIGSSLHGDLTMYGQDVDSPLCTDPGEEGDDRILPRFMAKLMISRTPHIFTFVSDTTLCHPSEYGGGEALALHEFLKEILVEQTGGPLSSPYADCVVDPFELYVPPTPDDPEACPNILKSMDNVIDTYGEDAPLILMADVELKIPR